MADYKIDYFELPTSSAAKSRGFFSKAFGWTFTEYGPDYVEINGAQTLGGLNADSGDMSSAPLLGVRTDDIVEAEKAVIAAGGMITKLPYDYPGGRRFFFREPGGAEMMVYAPND